MPQKEQKIDAAVYLYQVDNDGEIHLFMRIYVPDMTALHSWQPPVIREQ